MHDVIIVGGGPAGLSAALVLARARRKVLLFDSGQPRNASATAIHGYLGHDGITPQGLRELGRAEVARYGVEFVDGAVTAAERLDGEGSRFRVQTGDGREGVGRKLLFTTGMRDELPDLPGVRECYGASVHHCPYCDGWEHRGERILAYARRAKDAVGLGLALKQWSDPVTVLTGGEPLAEEGKQRLERNGIAWRTEPVIRVLHKGSRLQGVELADGSSLVADALFFETIEQPACELPRQLGAACEENFSARTSRKQKTNVPGLFVAGDADGNVQFAIVAAAEGATAAVAINRELLEEDCA